MQSTPPDNSKTVPLGPPEAGQVDFRAAGPDGRVISIVALFLLTLLFFGVNIVSETSDLGAPSLFNLVVFVLIAVLILYRWLGSVRGYSIVWGPGGPVDSRLVIRRVAPWLTRTTNLDRLRFAYSEPTLGPLLNTSMLSQGALFGWVGPAQVNSLGAVEAYATNNKKAVVLEFARAERAWKQNTTVEPNRTRGQLFILSPADPEGFANELRRLPGVGGKAEAEVGTVNRAAQRPAPAKKP